MAAPSETPSPLEGDEGNNGVEVCLFEESPDFSRAVRAMSELAAGEAELAFPDTEVQRLASSITFLREWRHFSYEPKGVSFTYGTESASSRHDPHEITLPQFSSASVPKVTHLEDERGNNTVSPDFVLFAGGNVWSLDWCPRLCDKPCSPVNCEYLAVSAHPPGSSYHKIGMPLIGRGIIQVWFVVTPFEDAHPDQSMVAYSKSVRRGRPRKTPVVNICSSNPPKPKGRPRKIKSTSSDDPIEPSLKRPRGRPRKYLLSVTNGDLALACTMPTVKSTPRKDRGRPRKIPVDKIKCLTGIELKENMSTALTSMEPKKKRGRPQKYPAPSISQHVSGIGTELGRETGCLPVSTGCNLGHTGYAESNSSLSDVTVDATISIPSSSSAICERGKRRHAKNPASTECSCSTTFSTEAQKIQTTPEPSNHRASVQNCKKLLVYTRRGVRQPKKTFASNEIKNMEKSSTCMMPNNQLSFIENSKPLASPISEEIANEAGLVGSKTGVIGCEAMERNDGNTSNQIVPVENSSQVIDDVEDTEVSPFKESIKNDNVATCAENLNFSPIPKGIHLPRVVLCLAHNGKVAWDIKWKPPLPNQSEQKSRLGFLAVLLGNGSLEVWEVPSPSMIQKIYSSSSVDGTDPRFLKLQPVFRCAKVKCGNRQSIPLTIDWSPSPHDLILVGCHDGTVALWKFSTDLPSQDSKPFMCVTADSVPVRALSWAPYVSEKINTFVTAGEDGLKFWDLRDPYRPLWELTTAPRAVLSLHWLKDARGIVISLEDGTLKFLSLARIANDVPVTGKPFTGTKTQGVSTYQLSEYLIWSVHVSEITDGTAVRFHVNTTCTLLYTHLTSRFWEKEPGKNRVPYFLCGSLAEEGTVIKISDTLSSPLSNVPLVPKKGPKSFQDVDQACDIQKGKLQSLTNSGYANLELRDGKLGGPDDGQETSALVLADPAVQENVGICNDSAGESLKDFLVFPPKAVALHRLRWNMNKGSERWLCYGGAAGIIRCQRI